MPTEHGAGNDGMLRDLMSAASVVGQVTVKRAAVPQGQAGSQRDNRKHRSAGDAAQPVPSEHRGREKISHWRFSRTSTTFWR